MSSELSEKIFRMEVGSFVLLSKRSTGCPGNERQTLRTQTTKERTSRCVVIVY